jgi:hypothetical protein
MTLSPKYMPEYWKSTKAMLRTGNVEVKEDLIRGTFGNSFEDELQAKQELWRITSPF